MRKYTVKYNGKTYRYTGENTEDVMVKFVNRKVFGNPLIINYRLKMYDADTRGEQWAQYVADDKVIMIKVS